MIIVGLLMAATATASDMTPGDLLIYRVGDGSTSLSSAGDPVFLDEYTPSGTLVQSFAAHLAERRQLCPLRKRQPTSEGMLTLSSDGRYVTFTGYTSLSGAGSLASSSATDINGIVGLIDT